MFLKRLSTLFVCVSLFALGAKGTVTERVNDDASSLMEALAAPNDLTVIVTPTSPKCYGGKDGKVKIEIYTGSGTAPISYRYKRTTETTWSSWVNNQPLSFSISSLSSGSYDIQFEDADVLTSNIQVDILDPEPLKLELEQPVTNPTCSGGTVDLKFNAMGGVSPYSYQLMKGGTQDGGANADGDFLGKSSGSYSVIVTDNVGCTQSYNSSITVTVPSIIDISASVMSQPNCDREGFGSVKVNGVPSDPVTVTMKNNTTGSTSYASTSEYLFNKLDAGEYTVTVTRNSCSTDTDSENFSIEKFDAVTISTDPASNQFLNCTGDRLDVNVVIGGGRSGQNVRIVFDNDNGIPSDDEERTVAYGATASFPQMVAGEYTIRWYDVNNPSCSGSSSYVINAPSSVLSYLTDPTVTNVSCFGLSDGKIEIPVTGGTGTKTYYVDGISKTDPSQFALPKGTYTVYVEDENHCKTEERTVKVEEPEQLIIALAEKTDVSCNKGTDGSAKLSIAGGNGGYIYNVSGPVSRANISAGTDPTIASLLAGNYTVTVVDKNGCTSTPAQVDFIIEEPTQLQIDIFNYEEIQCYGGSTSLNVQASGGTSSSLSYELFKNNTSILTQTSADLVNFPTLTSGTYRLVIEGAPNCSSIDTTFTIAARKQIEIIGLQSTIEVACPGNWGTLTLSLKGEEPLTYSVDGGALVDYATTPTIDNLTAARGEGMNHIIKIVDAYGCEETVSVYVIEPEPLSYSDLVVTPLNCRSDNSGSVSLKISGGAPSYTATMNETSARSSDVITFTKVPAGSYNIEVKDSKGCILDPIAVEVTEPAEDFKLSVPVFDSILCYNGTTDLEVSASGGWGSGAINYFIVGGGTEDSNQTGSFLALKSGNYTISAVDGNGCKSVITQQIDQPSRLVMTYLGKFDITCAERSDGKIVVKAEGGTAPYSYGLEGGNSSFYPFFSGTVDTVKNLSKGSYSLTIQDANGCVSSSTDVVIEEPDPIELSIVSFTDVECFGEDNGKIVLSATGGVGNKTYAVEAITVSQRTSTSGSFENLPPAEYSLSVTDVNGCANPLSLTQEIGEPKDIFITSVDKSDVLCFGESTGGIVVLAAGGEPYEKLLYSLEGYAMSPQSNNEIKGLKKDSYTVVVSDSRGKCTHKWPESIVIDSPDKLEVIASSNIDVTCHDVQDGSIIREVKGGTPSYEFRLYNSSNTLLSTASGTTGGYLFEGLGDRGVKETYYKVEVIDGNGCSLSEENIRINNPDPIVVNSVVPVDVTCKGLNNGSIAINAVGGVGTLQYSLDGGISYTSATSSVFGSVPGKFTNLAPTEYEPWVSDANGCSPSDYVRGTRVEIFEPEELVGSFAAQEISCYGTNDGVIEITATGGNIDKPYWYSIDDSTSWSSNGTFSNVIPGINRLWVKDWKNCTDYIDVIEMVEPKELVMNYDTTSISCNGDNDASITFKVSGGEAPYALGVDRLFSSGYESFSDALVKDMLSPVEYIYYMKDSRNCPVNRINGVVVDKANTENYVFKHKFYDPASFYITAVDTFPEKCAGEGRGRMIIAVAGGVAPYQYNVQLATAATPYHSSWSENSEVTGLIAGTYNPLILDSHQCSPINAVDFSGAVIGAINDTIMDISVWDSEMAQCPYSKDAWVELVVSKTYENTFSWTLTSAGGTNVPILSGENTLDSMVSLNGLNSDVYEFTIMDLKSKCETSEEITISYKDSVCEEMFVPTAFTPNGDGVNDTWVLENTELYSHIKIQVFTVNGELVLDINGPLDPEWAWDGRYRERDLPVGTYIWMIWKNYDYVGKLESGLSSTATSSSSDESTNVTSADTSSKKSRKSLAKPDFIGNVTILRGNY